MLWTRRAPDLDRELVDALRTLAAARDGAFAEGQPGGWFDGFWDFYVRERPRFELAAAAHVAGCDAPWSPWYVLAWHPPGAPAPRLDLFVEMRDERPDAVAPWPVSEIYVDSGEPVPPRATRSRSLDEAAVAALAALGFNVALGYWGTHTWLEPVTVVDTPWVEEALRLVLRVHVVVDPSAASSPE